jgi:hypothetical protein
MDAVKVLQTELGNSFGKVFTPFFFQTEHTVYNFKSGSVHLQQHWIGR